VLVICLALRHAAGWEWVSVWLVAVSLGALVQGVFTVAVGRILFSEELTARAVLRIFAGRLGSYLGALVVSRILLGAACLPFFLGLPFAWPRLVFVHEACLLEGAGPSESIARSNRFISGRALGVFGVLAALLAAQLGIAVSAELLGQGLTGEVLQLGNPLGGLFSDGGSAFALAGFLLSIPYAATARFLQYIDARTRSDGWDIQLRFMSIAARDAAENKVAA
jgi:hypothetical protein